MTCHILQLQQHQLPEVYALMCAQDFPNTPDDLHDALAHFVDTQVLGIYDDEVLQAAFILLDFTDNAACLDVVCHPHAQGRWATRHNLRQLYHMVFERFALDYIWAEPKNTRAMKACFQAGFQIIHTPHQEEPVMALSRSALARLIKHERT